MNSIDSPGSGLVQLAVSSPDNPSQAIFAYTQAMSSLLVQGILFDLDGVLIDSTAGVTRVWRDWGIRHGLDPDQTAHTAHGRRAIDTVRLLAPHLDAEAELRDLERREIADSYDVAVFPGAVSLLAALHPGQWAIVTSGTRDLASHRLRVAGLPIPELMITASDIGHGKPHPEPYQCGARLLGLPTAACIAVEDAPSGIRSALDAGMPVLALPTTYHADELTLATSVLPELAALQATMEGDFIRLSW